MSEFKKLEGASCLLVGKNGSYKAASLYEYNGLVYARSGNQYVKLLANEYTSHDNWRRHRELNPGENNIARDMMGRLCVDGGTNANVTRLNDAVKKMRA